ncbi:uncharacterized protein LOC141646087 [Silene latifolia]|uniref:uncharacterized protein LOC141646087 n=1 Tax=Silene latifolia TaxID=37657 RepID=UPI003D78615E
MVYGDEEDMATSISTKLKVMRLRFVVVVATVLFFTYCDARTLRLSNDDISLSKATQNMKHLKILEMAKSLNMLMDASVKDTSNLQPYINSPLTLSPYDSLAPISLPNSNNNNNNPPYCVYPPPPSLGGSTPSPIEYSPIPTSSPPPSPPDTLLSPPVSTPSPLTPITNPPNYEPSPPSGNVPSPPEYVPSPIGFEPSPPEYVPTPIGFEPSPPVFEPPVVYPPPTVPPPPSISTGSRGPGVWCVAKPSVPDPIIQEAMNYACGSGADCDPIQPNGQCFAPNTLLAHASYAFNSFWQRTKAAGGTCSFGGTAILVTVDPSSQGCRFVNY